MSWAGRSPELGAAQLADASLDLGSLGSLEALFLTMVVSCCLVMTLESKHAGRPESS